MKGIVPRLQDQSIRFRLTSKLGILMTEGRELGEGGVNQTLNLQRNLLETQATSQEPYPTSPIHKG